jgi:multisubunit Na+/H+ antiporter MnhG subunit
MSFEAAFSLWAAWRARSPALLAFGGDSAIELLSATVVLWRFRSNPSEHAERTAARTAGALLILLAVYVVLVSGLSLRGYLEPRPSYLGIAVLVAAALIMPWLAREKRRLSAETGSAALRADAAESTLSRVSHCMPPRGFTGLIPSLPWQSRLLFSMRPGRLSAENRAAAAENSFFHLLPGMKIRPPLLRDAGRIIPFARNLAPFNLPRTTSVSPMPDPTARIWY